MNVNRQRGSALILSLLILLVMTMLGITAMSTATLEEKMAANDRNHKLAFQNGELALAQTETELRGYDWMQDVKGFVASDTTGFIGPDETPNYHDPATWDSDGDCDINIAHNDAESTACRIVQIMEERPPLEQGGGYGQPGQNTMGVAILRVTAQGRDGGNATRAMVQSSFEKNIIP